MTRLIPVLVSLSLLVCFCPSISRTQSARIPEVTLETIDNESESLGDILKTGPVYISFWALWCEPCKTELKALQRFHEKFGKEGLSILAINRDTQKSLAKVRSYIAAKGYTFRMFIDPDAEMFERLNGEALPYSLLVARDGTIAHVYTGFLPGDDKNIELQIKALLRENAGTTEDESEERK